MIVQLDGVVGVTREADHVADRDAQVREKPPMAGRLNAASAVHGNAAEKMNVEGARCKQTVSGVPVDFKN